MGKVVVSLRMIRLHTKSLLIQPDGLVISLKSSECDSEVMMSVDRSPFDFERMAEKIGGSAKSRLLEPDQA
jgi:hypothetical protein